MGFYGLGLVFFGAVWQPLGYLGALGALATVFTTAMIYTQMKTVPRWRHWTTPALFLTLSLLWRSSHFFRALVALRAIVV